MKSKLPRNNAEQKKEFHDSSLFLGMSHVSDMLLLNILWLALSLLVLPIGVASTGAYFVTTKKIVGNDSYIWQDFFKSVKQNWRMATGANLLFMGAGALLFFNFSTLDTLGVAFFLQTAVAFQVLIVGLWFYPVLSRFELSFFATLKASFWLANRHMLTSLLMIACLVGLGFLAFVAPVIVFFMPGIYIYVSSIGIVKVFRKHWKNFDVPEATSEQDDAGEV